MTDYLDKILRAMDDLDNAAQRILCALPHQMTEAAQHLETVRLATRTTVQQAAFAAVRPVFP